MTNHFVNMTETNLSKAVSRKKDSIGSSWTIWDIGIGIGLLGGTLLLFGGCFLIIFQYFSGEKPLGVWLFLAVLPLWVIGAHCFDKIEETKKKTQVL
jgi:hypothetical protein